MPVLRGSVQEVNDMHVVCRAAEESLQCLFIEIKGAVLSIDKGMLHFEESVQHDTFALCHYSAGSFIVSPTTSTVWKL